MVEYTIYLEFVKKGLKSDYGFNDDEITSLLSENEDLVIDDYKRCMMYRKQNPKLKDNDAMVSGICQTLSMLA